jgi:hypothetical protein
MRGAAIAVLAVLAGGGLYGGVAFLARPDGSALGMEADMLPSWLPGDYALPGAFLLAAFAAAPVVAIVLLRTAPARGWLATGAIGVVLLAWMAVQIAIIGLEFPALQLTFVAVGAALAALGWLGWLGSVREDS